MTMTEKQQSPFMRKDEVNLLQPIADSTRKREEQNGRFPKRIHLSAHVPAWRRDEVMAWVADPAAWTAAQRGAS